MSELSLDSAITIAEEFVKEYQRLVNGGFTHWNKANMGRLLQAGVNAALAEKPAERPVLQAEPRKPNLTPLELALEVGWEKWYAGGCHEPGCGCVTEYMKNELAPFVARAERAAFEKAAQCVEIGPPVDMNWSWNRDQVAKAIRALADSPVSGAAKEKRDANT